MENLSFKKYGGLRAAGKKRDLKDGLPMVSVVTIVRNDAEHLEKTILSIINQTYPNIEYIVVDGASTDDTVEVIKKYEDKIDLWISEPDKGTHDAINKGISQITGKWVNIMHCGDYFFDDTVFEKIFLKGEPKADIVYGDFVGIVNESEKALFRADQTVDRFWEGMVFCHQAVFTKTEWIRRFPFDTKYVVSSDYDFYMRCLLAGAVFKKIDTVVFEVGTLGISSRHWLKARLENWEIGLRFPGPKLRTHWYHFQGLAYDVFFRNFKKLMRSIGVYEYLKGFYRHTIKSWIKRNSRIEKI
jgi:glycosyltransferase involved in cell wall biosynthesis